MRPLCIIWRRCLPKRRDGIKGFLMGMTGCALARLMERIG
jgi:hypothetical protein